MSEKPPLSHLQEEREGKSQESNQYKKILARELKTPRENSFFKQLCRMGTAFFLSGFIILHPAKKVFAPNLSKNFLTFHNISSLELNSEENIKAFKNLLEAIEEKGGIEISPQMPDTIYKPLTLAESVAKKAETKTRAGLTPYFSKPEIIFGKDFIQNNPEQSKKYFEKICQTIRATTVISAKGAESGDGSGVVIQTKNGAFVLTSEHVIANLNEIRIQLADTSCFKGKLIARDKQRDLALLEIIFPNCKNNKENKAKKNKFLIAKNIKPLSVNPTPKIQSGDDCALIGNPYGYPNEVSLAKAVGTSDEKLFYPRETEKREMNVIWSAPDTRFRTLALFQKPITDETNTKLVHTKGEAIPGMSGGPIINLSDPSEEPSLIAINSFYMIQQQNTIGEDTANAGVSGKDIHAFLKENNL